MEKIHRKAQYWARIIGRLPGVAAVFLSGSVAQGRGTDKSDIDFFIIAEPGRIWTARFWVNLGLKLSFNLAKPHCHAGRVCPNHFITADSLEIVEKDVYSAHLFSHNQPLYDPHQLWPQFVERNAWVGSFGEKFPVVVRSQTESQSPCLEREAGAASGGNHDLRRGLAESFVRWIQLCKIRCNPDFKKPGAKIILRDTELRFHPDPKNQYWQAPPQSVDLNQAHRQADVEVTIMT